MKKTIITLASVATLASAVNAQVTTQKFAFMDGDSSDGTAKVYEYTYNHTTSTWSTGNDVSSGWNGWTDISYDNSGNLAGYNQSTKVVYNALVGTVSSNAPTANAAGTAYHGYSAINATTFEFQANDNGKVDIYSYDSATDAFTFTGTNNASGGWHSASNWLYDSSNGTQFGYHTGTNAFFNSGGYANPTASPSTTSPDGTAWSGFAAQAPVTTTVPEPSSTALLGLGGLALLLRRKK